MVFPVLTLIFQPLATPTSHKAILLTSLAEIDVPTIRVVWVQVGGLGLIAHRKNGIMLTASHKKRYRPLYITYVGGLQNLSYTPISSIRIDYSSLLDVFRWKTTYPRHVKTYIPFPAPLHPYHVVVFTTSHRSFSLPPLPSSSLSRVLSPCLTFSPISSFLCCLPVVFFRPIRVLVFSSSAMPHSRFRYEFFRWKHSIPYFVFVSRLFPIPPLDY